MELVERIEKLETQNQRLMRIVLLMLCGGGFVVCAAAAQQGGKSIEADEVRARRFVVVDEQGKELAGLLDEFNQAGETVSGGPCLLFGTANRPYFLVRTREGGVDQPDTAELILQSHDSGYAEYHHRGIRVTRPSKNDARYSEERIEIGVAHVGESGDETRFELRDTNDNPIKIINN